VQKIYRNTYPDGRLVAEMAVGAARFRVADESARGSQSQLAGTQADHVRICLLVPDPDAVAFAVSTPSLARALLRAGRGGA
jgi:hypothetical protein